MKRGEVYLAQEKGRLTGKPRPVLVIRNDRANRSHTTVTVCLVSSTVTGNDLFRVLVIPTSENGLDRPSEVQVDRIFSFMIENLTQRIGLMSVLDLRRIDIALRRWLDL